MPRSAMVEKNDAANVEAEDLEGLREQLARRERELHAVHQITAALHARTRLDEMVQQTLMSAIDAVCGSAGSILLYDPLADRLVFRYVVGESDEITRSLIGREMPADQGIAGTVFRSGHGVITRDARADTQHYREIDLATHYTTHNMLTAPLKTTEGHVIGVMQVLNRRDGDFDDTDLEVMEILSGHAASALETASLHERVLQAETERKRFCREVLRSVTNDKLHVVDQEEIPTEGRLALELSLEDPTGYPTLQRELREIAEGAGMRSEAAEDLLLAAAEAATNAIKHATGGRCQVYVTSDRVLVRVSDRGEGISTEDLPAAVLMTGYSTKVSLGLGYTVMLRLSDRIWLATDATGTVLQLEKWIDPQERPPSPLFEALERC